MIDPSEADQHAETSVKTIEDAFKEFTSREVSGFILLLKNVKKNDNKLRICLLTAFK